MLVEKENYFALLVIADLSTEDENGDIPSRRNRVNWVRPWMARREERGVFHQLAMELAVEESMLADTQISLDLTANSSSFYSMQFHTEYLSKIQKV